MRRQRRPRTYKIKFSRGTERTGNPLSHHLSELHLYSNYYMQVGIWFRFTLSVTSRHGTDLLPWLKGGQLWNKSTKTWYYMWKYRQWHTIVCSWILAPGWCIFFYFFLDLKGLYWNAFFHFNTTLYFISIQLFPLSVFMSEFNFFSLHLVRHLNTFTVKTTPSMATLAT